MNTIKNKKGNILTFDHVEIDDNFKIIYAFTNNVIHCYSVSDEGSVISWSTITKKGRNEVLEMIDSYLEHN